MNLTLRPDYRQMHFAITGMLDYTPRIDPALLDELHAIATRRT